MHCTATVECGVYDFSLCALRSRLWHVQALLKGCGDDYGAAGMCGRRIAINTHDCALHMDVRAVLLHANKCECLWTRSVVKRSLPRQWGGGTSARLCICTGMRGLLVRASIVCARLSVYACSHACVRLCFDGLHIVRVIARAQRRGLSQGAHKKQTTRTT